MISRLVVGTLEETEDTVSHAPRHRSGRPEHRRRAEERRTRGRTEAWPVTLQRGARHALGWDVFSVRLRDSVAPCKAVSSVVSVHSSYETRWPRTMTLACFAAPRRPDTSCARPFGSKIAVSRF